METLHVETRERETFVDITRKLEEAVARRGWKTGVLHCFVPHTTAGITVNEGDDPAVARDILAVLRRAVPPTDGVYEHAEGNSDAHIKTVLVGSSVALPIEGGALRLGRWQAVFFCEFDGPRRREVRLVFTPGEA